MPKRKSNWMQEHVSDEWVKKANLEGWRSRAAFKLLEIFERDKLAYSGMTTVDLGAAPGGWSQVVKKYCGETGVVFALDILDMEPLHGVKVIKGDFTEESTLNILQGELGGKEVDLVISDMAPNISGVKTVDQARWLHLAELALDFACENLKNDGHMIIKCFEGAGSDEFRRDVRNKFGKVLIRKPKASRDRSSEFFLVALNKFR